MGRRKCGSVLVFESMPDAGDLSLTWEKKSWMPVFHIRTAIAITGIGLADKIRKQRFNAKFPSAIWREYGCQLKSCKWRAQMGGIQQIAIPTLSMLCGSMAVRG